MPAQIQLRLFGGFRVEGGAPSAGRRFESQKVRALFAYLACHPGQSFTREQLAELLWPEEDSHTARHNLRQALYSLRQGLGERADAIVASDHQSVGVSFGEEDLFDVAEVEEAYHRGFAKAGEVAPAALARIAELYRGDFLSGFSVRDSPPFENWLITEQERFRDVAVQALRALVDHFSTRGEYEPALDLCHRLLEIDPLSEEAHHELIRHYVLCGRRPRAMRHYELLEELLRRELGVEPSAATRELYESLLDDRLPATGPGAPVQLGQRPAAPFVPLVGRDEAQEALKASWRIAVHDGARMALVSGEGGVGKTRLARTFLNQLSSRQRALIFQGRCTETSPWCGGDPLSGALRSLREHTRGAGLAAPAPSETGPGGGDLRSHLVAALEPVLTEGRPTPVALYLDDLHNASPGTCEMVGRILDRFAGEPLWVLATADLGGLEADHPLRRLARRNDVDPVVLHRLDDAEVEAVCIALLGDGADREPLAVHLMRASEGLPLALVETLNALCDQGLLKSDGRDGWSLGGSPGRLVEATPEELAGLILERVEYLPSSTRRLLTLASVIGVTFDVELLQRAAREHIGVVEIGIEKMLEHWLIRHYAQRWTRDPRERDLVLWAQGARRGTFEFAHPRIRQALYASLPPARRRLLHRQVAEALAERHRPGPESAAERVAYHFVAAGRGADALPYLYEAAEDALAQGERGTAARLVEHGMEAMESLGEDAEVADRPKWEKLRRRLRSAGSCRRPAGRAGSAAAR